MPQNFENGYLDMHAYTCEQILGGMGHGFKSVAYRTARRRNQGRNANLGKGSTLPYLELRHDALSPWWQCRFGEGEADLTKGKQIRWRRSRSGEGEVDSASGVEGVGEVASRTRRRRLHGDPVGEVASAMRRSAKCVSDEAAKSLRSRRWRRQR